MSAAATVVEGIWIATKTKTKIQSEAGRNSYKRRSNPGVGEVPMRSSILSLFVLMVVCGPAFAQGEATQTLAAEFTKQLSSRELTAFAAPLPDDPSRFVAALHIPGVQLLVMSARYQVPVLLRELIAKHDYRQVYLDLNAAAERSGRFFVEDLGGDGLGADRARDRPFDITWRNAVERTLYNSNWKEQQFSEDEYRARFTKDAAEYGQMLRVLLGALAAESREEPRVRNHDDHSNN
jgi:hypothetical protein